MDLLSVIRRWHFRQHVPIREIKRRTGLSRNTIRKYLRADMVEPKFKVPVRPGKLAPFADKLSGWLRQEAGKSRKQKRTAKQMHADLVVLGFDGSYGRVAAFVRGWKTERQHEQQSRSARPSRCTTISSSSWRRRQSPETSNPPYFAFSL
jgi:transposase